MLVAGLGCFIDGIPLVLIFMRLLMAAAYAYGINYVHFGVLFTYISMIVILTPAIRATIHIIRGGRNGRKDLWLDRKATAS